MHRYTHAMCAEAAWFVPYNAGHAELKGNAGKSTSFPICICNRDGQSVSRDLIMRFQSLAPVRLFAHIHVRSSCLHEPHMRSRSGGAGQPGGGVVASRAVHSTLSCMLHSTIQPRLVALCLSCTESISTGATTTGKLYMTGTAMIEPA